MPSLTDHPAGNKKIISEIPKPEPVSPPPPVRNVCKTPVSYFLRLLEFCNYTQLKVFGAVLVSTVGHNPPRTWSEVEDHVFDDATGVSSEFWKEALYTLTDQLHLIRTKKGERGRTEYALSEKLEVEIKARTVRGRCAHCHVVGAFETEFVPVPHAAFRTLGACIDHASFICLMVIVRDSLKWNAERGVWSEPVQLEVDDFIRFTGLERRMVSNALSLLCDPARWGLVERVERKGRPALYRALPERFHKIERRDPRTVTPRERAANTTAPEKREKPDKPAETRAIESDSRYYGFCKSCGHYAAVEDVAEQETPAAADPPPKRAGPGRALGVDGRKQSKRMGVFERMRRKYAGD